MDWSCRQTWSASFLFRNYSNKQTKGQWSSPSNFERERTFLLKEQLIAKWYAWQRNSKRSEIWGHPNYQPNSKYRSLTDTDRERSSNRRQGVRGRRVESKANQRTCKCNQERKAQRWDDQCSEISIFRHRITSFSCQSPVRVCLIEREKVSLSR